MLEGKKGTQQSFCLLSLHLRIKALTLHLSGPSIHIVEDFCPMFHLGTQLRKGRRWRTLGLSRDSLAPKLSGFLLIFLLSLLPSFSPAQVIFTSCGPSEIWAGGLALISSGFPPDPLLMSLGPCTQMFWLLDLKIHCPSPVCHPDILPLLFSVAQLLPGGLADQQSNLLMWF